MNCKYCGKKVVLVPSAIERAKKSGGTPEFYTALFPNHTECVLKHNREEVSALIRRTKPCEKSLVL